MIKRIKNNTGSDKKYTGQTITPGAYYTIDVVEDLAFKSDTLLQADIGTGDAVMNDGVADLDVPHGLSHLACINSDCIAETHVDASAVGDQKVLTYSSAEDAVIYQAVTASQVGLSSVDNTSDANKPVSTAQQTALNLKANLASPTFTGTVSGITKSMVGLSSVDNTSDSAKTIAGDVTGTLAASVVAKLQGRAVASTAPAASQVMSWNSGSSQWEPTTLASGASAAGAKGEIQVRGNSAGTFTAFADFNWDETKTSLQLGSTPGSSLADALLTGMKSVNSWVQTVFQNQNSGTQATTDLVVMNNLGTDSTKFLDIGMNSSGYSDAAYPLSVADDCYIYSEAANITIGTDNVGKYLLFHTGGFGTSNERLKLVDAAAAKDAYAKLSTHLQLLNDTTANRPTTALNGMVRYNTTTSKFEGYENGAWVDLRSGAPAHYINLTLSDTTNPYISCIATSYIVLSRVIFPGSTAAGAIASIKATISQQSGGQTSIRIYDLTNATTICEVTGFNDTAPVIKDLGTISNVPTGAAIFEVQVKTNNATKMVYTSSLQIKAG